MDKDTKVLKGTMAVVVGDSHYMRLDQYFTSLPGALREGKHLVKISLEEVDASPALQKLAWDAWSRYAESLMELTSLQDLADDEIAALIWAIDIDGNLVTDKDASYSVKIEACPLYE